MSFRFTSSSISLSIKALGSSTGTLALTSLLILPTAIHAADLTLEDTVVTASRTEQKLADVIGDVSVITAEQIQRAGQTTLAELLGQQAGIEMSSNGGIGKSTDIYMRGSNSTHALILIDGVRISSATTGVTAIQHIPLNQIERVEILRGPASSLYGADALGGVIQIFTKKGKGQPRFNASAGLGNYGTAIGSAGVSGRLGDTSFSLQGGMTHVNGISSIANKRNRSYNPDTDGYRSQNISASITQHFNANHELGLSVLQTDSRNFNDGGTSVAAARYDYFIDQTLSSYTLHSKNRFNEVWTSLLSVSRGIDDLNSYSKRPTLTTKSSIKTTQDQYLWQNTLNTSWGVFSLGTERREQEVETLTAMPQKQRDIQSYFAGWQKQFDQHHLQLNLRSDDNSQFGNKTTGNAAYAYDINQYLRANVGLGTAFVAPTFNQLYSPLTGNYIGNANLKPEEANNRELGLQFIKDGHQVNLTYYHNRVSDLIVTTAINNSVLTTPTNISNAILRGMTLSYQGQLAGFNLQANADFQRPEDQNNGNLLPRRAKEHGFLAISRKLNDWDLGMEVQSSSHRFNDTANAVRMSGYTLVNLYSEYRINNDWSLNARINNLFDRKYELAKDYGTLGTNLFVSVRYAPTL